jgi:hypothetical protein
VHPACSGHNSCRLDQSHSVPHFASTVQHAVLTAASTCAALLHCCVTLCCSHSCHSDYIHMQFPIARSTMSSVVCTAQVHQNTSTREEGANGACGVVKKCTCCYASCCECSVVRVLPGRATCPSL